MNYWLHTFKVSVQIEKKKNSLIFKAFKKTLNFKIDEQVLATFFIAYISYAENVTVESNLRDNDHELEENKRTKKICFKKVCISKLDNTSEKTYWQKVHSKIGGWWFLKCSNKGKELNYTYENKIWNSYPVNGLNVIWIS